MCIKKTKKKLPPADVIPDQSYKGCKGESDCSSNKSDMKINRENEYLESYSSNDLGATKIPLNHMPLGGQIPDFRWVWEKQALTGWRWQTCTWELCNFNLTPHEVEWHLKWEVAIAANTLHPCVLMLQWFSTHSELYEFSSDWALIQYSHSQIFWRLYRFIRSNANHKARNQ